MATITASTASFWSYLANHSLYVPPIQCSMLVIGEAEQIDQPVRTNPQRIRDLMCAVRRVPTTDWLQHLVWFGDHYQTTNMGGLTLLENTDPYYEVISYLLASLRPWVPNFILMLGRVTISQGVVDTISVADPSQESIIRPILYPDNFGPQRVLTVCEDLSEFLGWRRLLNRIDEQGFFVVIYQCVAALWLAHHQLDFSHGSLTADHLLVKPVNTITLRYNQYWLQTEWLALIPNYQYSSLSKDGRRYQRAPRQPPLRDIFRLLVTSWTVRLRIICYRCLVFFLSYLREERYQPPSDAPFDPPSKLLERLETLNPELPNTPQLATSAAFDALLTHLQQVHDLHFLTPFLFTTAPTDNRILGCTPYGSDRCLVLSTLPPGAAELLQAIRTGYQPSPELLERTISLGLVQVGELISGLNSSIIRDTIRTLPSLVSILTTGTAEQVLAYHRQYQVMVHYYQTIRRAQRQIAVLLGLSGVVVSNELMTMANLVQQWDAMAQTIRERWRQDGNAIRNVLQLNTLLDTYPWLRTLITS